MGEIINLKCFKQKLDFFCFRNPNDAYDPFIGMIEWNPYDGVNSRNYLEIDKELSIKEDLNDDRFTIWDSLFPIEK